MALTSKVIYMTKKFVGEPKPSDFQVKEERLGELKNGEILVEAEWITVDPYVRVFMDNNPPGTKMIGGQVGRVLQSKHKDFKAGDQVVGYLGWSTRTIINIDETKDDRYFTWGDVKKVRHLDLSLSYNLGVLGMPGRTAYFGLLEICKPKAGETLVISAAAGAVGALVGQIAKVKGCKVIGFAGSDSKVNWLKNTLKFDYAFNYKTNNILNALKEAAPEGVDMYYDNVGGEISSIVISQMKRLGRIASCGAISSYNAGMANPPLAPTIQGFMVFKELKMEGFVVARWYDRYHEAEDELHKWIKEGKINVQEHVVEGFDNLPNAFIGLLRGENTGKVVVKV